MSLNGLAYNLELHAKLILNTCEVLTIGVTAKGSKSESELKESPGCVETAVPNVLHNLLHVLECFRFLFCVKLSITCIYVSLGFISAVVLVR